MNAARGRRERCRRGGKTFEEGKLKGRECRSGSTMPHVAKNWLAWLRALCKLTSAAGEQGAHSGMFRTWSCRQRGPLIKSPRCTRQIYESGKSCLSLDSGFVIPFPGVRLTPVYSLVAALVSGALRQAIWGNRGSYARPTRLQEWLPPSRDHPAATNNQFAI